MQELLSTIVKPEEIDSLGHMNVRYYMSRMERANRALLAGLDIDEKLTDSLLVRADTYTRFRREQFEGATLSVRGGITGLHEGGMQSYVEIVNPDTTDIAATFIVTTALANRESREIQRFPDPGNADYTAIDVPDYAVPRSLDLGPVNSAVTYADLNARIPEVEGGGMMSGRRYALVEEEDVDASGWLKPDMEVMFLAFAKAAQQSSETQGPPVFKTSDGRRVGWAVMETRNLHFAQAKLGDEIATFSADISVDDKARHSRRWAYNIQTERLLGISDTIGVCIDLDARKAVSWPDELRSEIEKHKQPDLA